MRIFRATYTINENPGELESILDGCLSRVDTYDDAITYIDNEDLGVRRFFYSESDGEITVEFESDYRYPLYGTIVITSGAMMRFTNVLTGPLRLILLLAIGLSGIQLFFVPHLLANKEYEFLSTSVDESEIFGVPHLYRSELKIAVFVYVVFLSSLATLWPILMPNNNLLVIITTASITLSMLISARADLKDQITAQLLFLYTITILPLAATVGSVALHTQSSAYRQQERAFLNEISNLIPFEGGRVLYNFVSPHSILCILIINAMAFFLIVQITPRWWSYIRQMGPKRPNTHTIGHDGWVQTSMILLIGTYAISVILIPTSIIFNLDIINTRLIPDLLLLYLPLIGGICLHISLRFKSYYKLRAELSTLAQEGSELTTEHRVETVLSDKINVAATSADLLLRKPVIIINKSFAQNLNSSELRAIYYHELYHIKQKTDKIQNLPNIPLIGPLLFLTVISPREVYREEFKADQFAVEKEGRDAVIGALQKAKESGEVSEHRHVAQPNQQKMLPFLILLASVPILSLYRPSKMERIDKMRSIKPNRD